MLEKQTDKIGKIDETSVLLLIKYALGRSVAAEISFLSANTMLVKFENGKRYQLKITEIT